MTPAVKKNWSFLLVLAVTMAMISFSMNACGRKSNPKDWAPPFNKDTSKAIPFTLADPDCQNQEPVSHVQTATVGKLLDGQSIQNAETIEFSWQGQALKAAHLGGVFINTEAETRCQKDGESSSCLPQTSLTNMGKPLRICRQNADYPRDSLEFIALSSGLAVERFFQFLQRIPSVSRTIGPVNVFVYPKLYRLYPSQKRVRSDNLLYAASFFGGPAILVLPISDSGLSMLRGQRLWESTWVLSHESAHHVFRNYAQTVGMALRQEDHHFKTFGESFLFDDDVFGARSVEASDSLAAFNEGFADLLGYYAAGADPRLISRFNCFERTRDLASPILYDGTPKVLSQEILRQFFSTQVIAPRPLTNGDACSIPSYQDDHVIGAILAQIADQLFSAVVTTPQQKAELTLRWLQLLGRTQITANPQLFLQNIAKNLVITASSVAGGLNLRQCQIVREKLPTYFDQWQQSRTIQCGR